MQFLMVLLVMIGVIVLMLAALLGISYGMGTFMNSRDGNGVDSSNTDPCAQCRADHDWYEDLPIWKRNLVTVWWLANRYRCSAKGCG
jgi:hypothetical protein